MGDTRERPEGFRDGASIASRVGKPFPISPHFRIRPAPANPRRWRPDGRRGPGASREVRPPPSLWARPSSRDIDRPGLTCVTVCRFPTSVFFIFFLRGLLQYPFLCACLLFRLLPPSHRPIVYLSRVWDRPARLLACVDRPARLFFRPAGRDRALTPRCGFLPRWRRPRPAPSWMS